MTTYDHGTGEWTYWFLDEGLNPRWSFPGGSIRPAMLDCARLPNGNPIPDLPGVAYVAGGEGGGLRALIVDDAGLDWRSDWPRTGRDARGSNNGMSAFTPGCP